MAVILKHGGQVNAKSRKFRTPLQLAAAHAGKRRAAEVTDVLLRFGVDETVADGEVKKAVDVLATYTPRENRLAEDVDGVRKLLGKAPADRAWRRGGYLMLCRYNPNKVRQTKEFNSTYVCTAPGTCDGGGHG